MPSVSKKQQKFMGIVRAIQKGEADPSDFNKDAQDAAKKMKKSSVKKYAKTKHKGLPNKKVSEDKFKKLPGKVVAKRMMSIKSLKPYASMIAKKKSVSTIDLERELPYDKVSVKDIDKVMKESVNEGRVLHFTKIKDKTLEKHLKVIAKKVGATVSKISGGFKVDADNDGRKLAQVVDYIFDKSLMKGLMSGGGMSRVQLVNESNGSKRDYKAEYKKFQSSPKAKKYRAELNKYNRQKGTYGNGDGKDASHKGGKIVGFEAQSKNRGRAEKSRLKKESLQENLLSFYQYMGDFYGKKGIYPDKKGRDLKVGDINKALSVYLKKYSKDTFTGDSLDRERVRDILIKMKKIDPQYKKQEVKENRDKIKKYLMSKGDNEKDATDKLRYYDLVKKLYKGSPPAKQAQIMSSLWANEGIEEGKMRPAVKKLLKQKGYSPIFNAIDQSKRQFKQMRYSRGEIQDTLIDMFGDEDPKILQKIKENLNEAVSKSQAQEIMRQLGGRKFEMLMGVKSKGVGKDGLIIHIGRNPKKVSHIIIDLDRGKDLYNIKFGKIYKYKFKIIKNLKGVGVEQMHDVIEKYTGMLTTFRPR